MVSPSTGPRSGRWERDPSEVLKVIGQAIVGLTDHEYALKHARMDALATRLARVPALLDVARARSKRPTHAALENLAIMAKGMVATLPRPGGRGVDERARRRRSAPGACSEGGA